jgi:hypothetical protein
MTTKRKRTATLAVVIVVLMMGAVAAASAAVEATNETETAVVNATTDEPNIPIGPAEDEKEPDEPIPDNEKETDDDFLDCRVDPALCDTIGDRLSLDRHNRVPKDFDERPLDGSADAVAAARSFLLAKLPELGINITDELYLHTDMVVAVTESEYHIEFALINSEGRSHEGHVEVANGEVVLATIDGKTIFSAY